MVPSLSGHAEAANSRGGARGIVEACQVAKAAAERLGEPAERPPALDGRGRGRLGGAAQHPELDRDRGRGGEQDPDRLGAEGAIADQAQRRIDRGRPDHRPEQRHRQVARAEDPAEGDRPRGEDAGAEQRLGRQQPCRDRGFLSRRNRELDRGGRTR